MTDQSEKRWSPISLVISMIVLLVFYVLSLGPAIWIIEKIGPAHPVYHTFEIVYAPLEWLYRNSEIINSFLDWYIALWRSP